MNPIQLEEELKARIERLEKRDVEKLLTMLEVMSNITFFGEIKKGNCEYAKNGQCGLFYIQNNASKKIPIATRCRIAECDLAYDHCHLEANNVTCTLCPQWISTDAFFKPQPEIP